jgi:hypothetical protein
MVPFTDQTSLTGIMNGYFFFGHYAYTTQCFPHALGHHHMNEEDVEGHPCN